MSGTTARRRRQRLDEASRAWASEWFEDAVRLARRWQAAFPDLRDEIESEACLALIDATLRRDHAEDFAGFLANAVRRSVRLVLRNARPKGYRRSSEAPPTVTSLVVGLESRELPPDRRLLDQEFRESIFRHLNRNQADALGLVVFGGYSYEEAASEMNISFDSARSHVLRARRTLRERRKAVAS